MGQIAEEFKKDFSLATGQLLTSMKAAEIVATEDADVRRLLLTKAPAEVRVVVRQLLNTARARIDQITSEIDNLGL